MHDFKEMILKINKLERAARIIDPDKFQRFQLRKEIFLFVEKFLSDLPQLKAYEKHFDHPVPAGFEIDDRITDVDSILQFIDKQVTSPGLNTASGANFGYIPGGGIYLSALADYLAAATNSYSGVFFASPGAVRIENAVIKWTAELVGFREGYGGNITSGGSIANLIALWAAKKAKKLTLKTTAKSVIYFSDQTHHSIVKALSVTGLDECVIRIIPANNFFRLDIKLLEEQINNDVKAKLIPFLIVANAGSTNTGSVDELDKIASIAKAHNIWLHTDAAYGGFFLLTKHGKEKLKGISGCDSIILDPHKSMFLPYGSGMIILKDKRFLLEANEYSADYMQDTIQHETERSPSDFSPELSRHFRGMRMWLPLKLYGSQPFSNNLSEKIQLARYFYEKVKRLGFKTLCIPDLSVVVFWYVPLRGNINTYNKNILSGLQQNGEFFISSTTIGGQFMLRLAVLSFRTHLSEVDALLRFLKRTVTHH